MLNRKKDPLESDKIEKFLTKEERAKIATENRIKEVEKQKIIQENARIQRENFFKRSDIEIKGSSKKSKSPKPDNLEWNRDKNNKRSRHRDSRSRSNDRNTKNNKEKEDELKAKELDRRYIGGEKEKKKRKQTDKKFNFDWDKSEDTTQFQDNFNLLSEHLKNIGPSQEPVTSFGKGRIAGFYNDTDKDDKDKPLQEMTSRDWRIFKEDYDISTKGGNIPNPLRSWEESPELTVDILRTIHEIKYKEPTKIQRQALPIAFSLRDFIGVAETGSGKTASFILPMLVGIKRFPKFNNDTKLDGPYGLVLVPTRELAIQIEKETQKLAANLNIIILSIVGGHNITEQAINLRNGSHIVIATPGRLKDCLESRMLALNQCSFVVLDEADRMVDLGFEPDLNFILDSLPPKEKFKNYDELSVTERSKPNTFRQVLMFSATMPLEVQKISVRYLKKPAIITVGNAGQIVDSVKQIVEVVNNDSRKQTKLMELLNSHYEPPIIVFVNTKKYCDIVARQVSKAGFRSVILHGGKSQEQREASLKQLKDGGADILVATDVAGRGIDIKNVGLVVNYDMAKNIEDYTHRIGRTGRAGAKGTAITFVNLTTDVEVLYDLRQALLKKVSPNSIPNELNQCEAALKKPGTVSEKKRGDQILYAS